MTELLSQNKDPLNQASKKALLRAKQKPDPGQLFSLQLAKWGLESGKLDLQVPELEDNLEGLLSQPPEDAHRFLLQGDDPESEDFLDPLRDAGPNPLPLTLAQSVLESLHLQLMQAGHLNRPALQSLGLHPNK